MSEGADSAEHNRSLLHLAEEKFEKIGGLTQAERLMFEKAEEGVFAACIFNDGDSTDPAKADGWDNARVIHADRIQWLCTDAHAKKRVADRGIQVMAARIEGKLDLLLARIPFPLTFAGCAFAGPINLIRAEVRGLYLDASHTKSISADGVKVEGDVNLRDGFSATGEVRLRGASIGGDLECGNATFSNPHGYCLSADGVKVEGAMFLREGFEAQGRVSLIAAEVKRHFQWRGVRSPAKVTLDLRSAKLGTLWDDEKSWPTKGNLYLQGLEYGEIFHDAPHDAQSRITWLRLQREERFPRTQINRIAREIREKDVKDQAQWIEDALDAEFAPHEDDAPWRELDQKLRNAGADDVTDRIQEVLDAPREPSFSPQPYEQLAEVLKKQGHDEDAKDILVAKNEDPAFLKRMRWRRRPFHWVFGAVIGYGYRPWRALWIGLFIIAVGCGAFSAGWRCGLITPSNVDTYAAQDGAESGKIAEDYPTFNFIMYSIDTFVPIVDFHQEGYWLPNPNKGCMCHVCCIPVRWGGLLRLYLWFHIAAGWLLTTLFAVGLTGLIRS